MSRQILKPHLLNNKIERFGFNGFFASASLRCYRCEAIAQVVGMVTDSEELAVNSLLGVAMDKGWTGEDSGAVCPQCSKPAP